MRAFKRFIIALLSVLLLFILASFLSIALDVKAFDRYDRYPFSQQSEEYSVNIPTIQPPHPTRYFPKPTWWHPPNPSTTPKPTNIPTPPYLSDGTVIITALVTNCGNKSPYAGAFQLCEGQKAESCRPLTTDRSGAGKLTTNPGMYTLRPPLWCPLGAYCIAGGSFGKMQLLEGVRPLIADPYTWNINPQNFFLTSGGSVHVSALGHNNLLMCPIQVSE